MRDRNPQSSNCRSRFLWIRCTVSIIFFNIVASWNCLSTAAFVQISSSPRRTGLTTIFRVRSNNNNNNAAKMPITLDVSLFSTTWVNEASPSDIIQRKNKELLPEPTAAVTVSKEKRISTMRDAVSTFFLGDYHGPGMVAMAISGLLLWRGCLGCSSSMGFYADDVAAALGAVSFWCFQEHWMHRYLLHSDMDWYGKQIHEQHHLKPYHHISIDPAPLMISWLTAVHFLLRVFLPLPLAVSATIGYAVAGLFYEWSHFIVHTKVRFPSNSYWQRMKDHHIRHHLVDCENWFAFSCIQVDDLFGTNPSVQEQKQAKRLNDTILVEPKVHPHRIVPL